MSEVITTNGLVLQSSSRDTNQKVIDCLQSALEKAVSGEIIGVSVVYRFLDGAGGRSAAGIGSSSMIGQMAIALAEHTDDAMA